MDNATVADCDAPTASEYGWFVPNAADNTCELTISCSLSEGSTGVQIPVKDWGGNTLVSQTTSLTVLGATFAISPSSVSLSRQPGAPQPFTITVTNPTGTCASLPRPTVAVQNSAVASCTVPAGGYTDGADGTCTIVIPCNTGSTSGNTGITITALDWKNRAVATQSTTLFVVSGRKGGG